jgi:two-component system, chemotaxis family, chemotaxis protein CheY
MKCLIVEDDVSSRLLLEKLLEPYGSCQTAENGVQALQAVSAALEAGEPYDLICLDIMMPEMDGQTALKEIRSLERSKGRGVTADDSAKVFMTTALTDRQNILTACDEQADGYLFKPIQRA